MSVDVSGSKVLVYPNTSNAYKIEEETGGKSFTCILIRGSIAGHVLAQFIVYRSKKKFSGMVFGCSTKDRFLVISRSWLVLSTEAALSHLFEWVGVWEKSVITISSKKCFWKRANHLALPVLLILDGHKSRSMIATLSLAVKDEKWKRTHQLFQERFYVCSVHFIIFSLNAIALFYASFTCKASSATVLLCIF